MAQQIERLARFVAETRLEQVPKDVQQHAKLVVLDTIGVHSGGRKSTRGARAARAIERDRRDWRHHIRPRLADQRSAYCSFI